MSARLRAGFTLLEMMLVIGLLAIVLVKLTMVMEGASSSQRRETAAMALEDNARRVLDRIGYALMGAIRDQLLPDNEIPLDHDGLTYFVSLGVQDGKLVVGDPERIGLSADQTQVVWSKNPATPAERRVAWCNSVRALLEEELGNGLDDNTNGLTDEKGLSFAIDGDTITIRLTLEQPTKDGTFLTRTVETTVTCRN